MAVRPVVPRQPECAGGVGVAQWQDEPPRADEAIELQEFGARLAVAHYQQLEIDAAFDRAVGEGRR